MVVESRTLELAGGVNHKPSSLPDDLRATLERVAKAYTSPQIGESILKIAQRPPPQPGYYPHRTFDKDNHAYKYEPASWWTAGFFPGSIWKIYERSLTRPQSLSSQDILAEALKWQKGLEPAQYDTSTHDLGFVILPSFYSHYRLCDSEASKSIVINAAKSLSSRWSEIVQSIRSWERVISKRLHIDDTSTDFLVIADNMMNLDLLYLASELTGDHEFARRATIHAKTSLKHFLRPDGSTCHLVNFDPNTGAVKAKYTVQGYADDSTWGRGQAWAMYGYATAYKFTRDPEFLNASLQLTEVFCRRVNETSPEGAVWWDFDAPRDSQQIRDTSAAMAACSGMLLLYQLTGMSDFLPTATRIMEYTVSQARVPGSDTILVGATVNNNKDAITPSFETGLVYADYYFLEVGNRLMELGFTS